MDDNTLAKRSDIHLVRRLWHVLCGVICLFCYHLFDLEILYWGFIALAISLVGFVLDFSRFKNPDLNETLAVFFGPIMRTSEKLSFSGLPFYALGAALSIFMYQEDIAILSILFLVFADPMASVFGVTFGKDKLLPNKTLQGTVAAFITCFVIAISYCFIKGIESPNIIMFAFLGAVFGALSELLSAFNIDDNLTIPVVSGAVLSVLNHVFVVF